MTIRINKFNYIDKSTKLVQVMNADPFKNDNYSQFYSIGFGSPELLQLQQKMNKTQ